MIIKKVAVGNREEAFVEDRIKTGLNIISSDENNKGKTIVIQSMMYALGNEPTFPVTFEYKKYYYYVEFESDNIQYCICRFNNEFILKHGSVLMLFDSVSELKRYWTKQIFQLPKISKNQIEKIVDPVLFFQLFFIGQDIKDTSNISLPGLYNKQDYYNMLYDICDFGGVQLNEEKITEIQERIKEIKEERKILLKQHKILKSQKLSVSYLSPINDRDSFAKKIIEMDKLKEKITELRKTRNSLAVRKSQWESTLKELRSLNRSIECGELRCMDCQSTNITFNSSSKKEAYVFDVSSVEMRTEIIASIEDKIAGYDEEVEMQATKIEKHQLELQKMMSEEDISLESIVAYKKDIFDASDAEEKINSLDEERNDLENQLYSNKNASDITEANQKDLLDAIISLMNKTYKEIDSRGNLFFEDLFTKRNATYSGSEATIFHLVKLYSLAKVINHNYPIVVDSFRAEDLSTAKESIIIDLYKELNNQIIFTTTLKKEELGKYDKMANLNHIDYVKNEPSKLLTSNSVPELLGLLDIFSINL